MQFGINRVDREGDRYHLFDDTGVLVLIAHQGNQPATARERCRFLRPDRQPVATLSLAHEPDGQEPNSGAEGEYIVVAEHAVYALISLFEPDQADADSPPFYIVEVEDEEFLLMRHQNDAPGYYGLYDQVPEGLTVYSDLSPEDLPEPVGLIRRQVSGYDFTVQLLPGQFRKMAVMVLAFIFLIDQQPRSIAS